MWWEPRGQVCGREGRRELPPPLPLLLPSHRRCELRFPMENTRGLTRTMWPVEMSMLDCTGSSDQDDVLLRADGLGIGPSLNWDETLLMRDACGASGRSDVRTAMRCRHSSWGRARAG